MDPRRYMCTTPTESLGGCQITGGAYPPGSGGQTANPTSEGKVGGIGSLASQALLRLTSSMSVQVSSMVFRYVGEGFTGYLIYGCVSLSRSTDRYST
jgi:hypothetical protein